MNIGGVLEIGITHLVMQDTEKIDQQLIDKFEILKLESTQQHSFKQIPKVMDFLRKCILYKGRILFIEGVNSNLITESILICLNQIFKTSTYEAYTLIKSQNLFFKIEADRLA
jgi:hypothetical protein